VTLGVLGRRGLGGGRLGLGCLRRRRIGERRRRGDSRRDHRHRALDAALSQRRKEVQLFHPLGTQALGDGAEKSLARVDGGHRAATSAGRARCMPRASNSRSTYSRRMCMKSCAFVTTPNAWCVPRSLSLLTPHTDESTQMVGSSRSETSGSVTNAGSMLPVAMACSAVAMRMAIVALMVCTFIASWQSIESAITLGNGPSSRMDPHST